MCKHLVTLLVLWIPMGCHSLGAGPSFASQGTRYHWGFYNDSKVDLSGVGFVAGRWNMGPGVLTPGSGKTLGSGFRPIPERGVISWPTPDGREHRQEVVIAANAAVLQKQSGTIWFSFDGQRWTVQPLTDAEATRRAAAKVNYPFLDPSDRYAEPGGERAATADSATPAPKPAAKEGPGYTWGFRNASGAAVAGPTVDFPRGDAGATGTVSVVGTVAPGGTAGGGFGVSPVPNTATVSWSAGGVKHKQDVAVPAVENPDTFDGVLWVEFGGGGMVKVVSMKRG